MSGDVIQNGLLQGRLPGRKEFYLYYLELSTTQFHIFDGQDSSDTRKHLLSLRIDSSDVAGIETKVRKGEFRFYLNRPGDGKYIFKVPNESTRDEWIGKIERIINKDGLDKIKGIQPPSPNSFTLDHRAHAPTPTKYNIPSVPMAAPMAAPGRGDSRTLPNRKRTSTSGNSSVLNTSLPPPPPGPQGGMGRGSEAPLNSPRASIISTDSGIGTSVGGEVCRPPLRKSGSASVPNSGSGSFGSRDRVKGTGHSADAEFRHGITVSDEDTPKWFWGTLSRQDCEDRLKTEGEIGNFVVRVNATGHHIMSFWRVDGVHHHKILHHDGMWRFEKAAVTAEGESLADLLDTYMKNCAKDKCIKPYGEFDMDLLGKKLKQQKELREKAKAPRRKQEYTPVEIDVGRDSDGFENDPLPSEETTIKIRSKKKPLPETPSGEKTAKKVSMQGGAAPAPKTKPAKKQGPPPPSKSGGGGGGMAFINELASRNKGKGTAMPATKDQDNSSSNTSTSSLGEDRSEECEPVYANTISQGKPYQNWEFGGPPEVAKITPPASVTEGVDTNSQSEYQNVGFKLQPHLQPPRKKPSSKQGKSPNSSPRQPNSGAHGGNRHS